jgi:hypothetical protein
MTDYNVRDVFSLFTGRCGHKWVAPGYWYTCPTCGGWPTSKDDQHVAAQEPIAVNFAYVLDKAQRRIRRAIRENRRKPRKPRESAPIISLADHRAPSPSEPLG